ncbi:FeoB-associated Cys-rich membrane protein [Clostridium sp. JS66]|uniref:FeoB-associated Cys-rich membrane protein n=1 Tax=Clostridium sp. JS66 TaxID=3064705 RepID=UPI00298E6D6A|nr:FeoB-associated Cys-rich membrane protein [Clostridium sp. JS66]WPC40447.1 FeoB-associated Cys-rich membrane protein [Clostridium sp. JS66]
MDYRKIVEFIIAGIIIVLAIYILCKNVKNRNDKCSGCGSCSKMCPYYESKKTIEENKKKHVKKY